MKTFVSLILSLFTLSASAQVVDDFSTGSYTDFSTYPGLTKQTLPSVLGGARYVLTSGTSTYIDGVRKGYFVVGANSGLFDLQLGWGNALDPNGPLLGLSLRPASKIVLGVKFEYAVNPVRAAIAVTSGPGQVSVSPVVDIGLLGQNAPEVDFEFVLSNFTGNADLAHINGIALYILPTTIIPGTTLISDLDDISVVR